MPAWRTGGWGSAVVARVVSSLALAGALTLAVALPGARADTIVFNQTFSNPGEHFFAVPPGLNTVHVTVIGGRGADNAAGIHGGQGATVSGPLSVTGIPGLYLVVGGNGNGPTGGYERRCPRRRARRGGPSRRWRRWRERHQDAVDRPTRLAR